MTELAIYDMDRTVTRTGTYTPFLLHAAWRLAPWRLLFGPAIPFVMLGYAVGAISRKRLKEVTQWLLLGPSIARARLRPVAESYAELVMRVNVLPGALRQIAEDRAAGRRLVLATASYRLYVEAIAARLGFDDVIATNSISGLDDRIMARIDGENCYGPNKLRMVEAWFRKQAIERSSARVRFYSDDASDAPVLEWADEPFAANPSKPLVKLAEARGWSIVRWAA